MSRRVRICGSKVRGVVWRDRGVVCTALWGPLAKAAVLPPRQQPLWVHHLPHLARPGPIVISLLRRGRPAVVRGRASGAFLGP